MEIGMATTIRMPFLTKSQPELVPPGPDERQNGRLRLATAQGDPSIQQFCKFLFYQYRCDNDNAAKARDR